MADEPGSALIAVLVTDLVGSTERRAALGEVEADRLDRSVHDTSSTTVIEHGGTVVKGLGDGLLATFGAAADAVAAAIGIQQAVAARHEVGLRVGVSVGDVARQGDGDVLGLPVVEAARLCAAAEPGQVLVADVVRLLAHGRAGEVFRSVGALELKGLPGPLAASAVEWEPLPVRRFPRPRNPALDELEAFRFVGRSAELGALRRALRRAEDGRRRVVVVAGEAGVGKSRLIAEALRLQASRQASTLLARCRPGADSPYAPLVALLDDTLEDWRAGDLAAALGPRAADGAALVPSIAGRLGLRRLAAPPDDDGAADVLQRLLDAWATEGPVFLVVEDAEHADPGTARLLARLAGGDRPPRLALVLSHDPAAGGGSAWLDELTRQPGVERLELDRLAVADVRGIVEFAAGRTLDGGDWADLAPLGDGGPGGVAGNPLYLAHFLRLLRDRGLLVDDGERVRLTRALVAGDVPTTVAGVVAARIDELPPTIRLVLARAAEDAAADADAETLAPACGLPAAEVHEVLAVAERLDFTTAADRPGRFRFSHDVVRAACAENGEAPGGGSRALLGS